MSRQRKSPVRFEVPSAKMNWQRAEERREKSRTPSPKTPRKVDREEDRLRRHKNLPKPPKLAYGASQPVTKKSW